MYPTRHDADALQFEFSAAEGHELVLVLQHLIFDADPARDIHMLESIHKRLCNAVYHVSSNRPSVLLELSTAELLELNNALACAGGSAWVAKFQITGELRCCLIAAPSVDRAY